MNKKTHIFLVYLFLVIKTTIGINTFTPKIMN